MSDPSMTRLPAHDNIKRRIRMLRHNNPVVKEPNDPNFSSVPIPLTKATRDDQFLRCDIGPGMLTSASYRIIYTRIYLLFIKGRTEY